MLSSDASRPQEEQQEKPRGVPGRSRLGSRVGDYGFAVLVTAGALLVQLAVSPYVQASPFLLFLGAVMLSGWKGGWGPGLLCTGLSSLVANFVFLPPYLALSLSSKDALSVALFLGLSVLITRLNVRERAARAEAERQRQRLLSLFMQAPAIIAIHRGPEHVYEFSNTTNTRLLGGRELLGRTVRQAQPELEGQGFYELLDRVYRTGEPVSGQEVPANVGSPGQPRPGYFNFVYQPLPEPEGGTGGVMVFGYEVTEQVLARQRVEALAEQLRLSEEQFRALVENLPALAWSADPDGSIDYFNRRWYEYTGTTPEQMLGDGWRAVHHPDWLEQVVVRWRHSVSTGEPFEMEFPLRGADGVYRWFLTRVSPLRDARGRVLRWFGTNTNVDEQRRQATLLQEAVQTRDIFLSIASHELKTPLTSLSLKLQALGRALQAQPGASFVRFESKDLTLMRRQVNRLSELVNALLDVSRIGTGRLTLDVEPVDLAELAREVVARFEPEAERAGCRLEVRDTERLVGQWDRLRLEQVLANLLSNALKYGAGQPVRVHVEPLGARARLVVRDEGIGIDAEAQARIFEKFERAVSERHYGGLGLGLYVTRQLVEAMGGAIRVESAPGQGATFTVELPRQPPAPNATP